MAWGWGISLELVGGCSGVRDFFLSFPKLPALVKGQQVIALRTALASHLFHILVPLRQVCRLV